MLKALVFLFFLFPAIFAEEPIKRDENALNPFIPPQGTTLSKDLRAEPTDGAPLLRTLLPTDQIVVLRSQGPWYEVAIETLEGLKFHGWLKGELALERKLLSPPKQQEQRREVKNPLESKQFHWFWSGKIKEKGSFNLSLGAQNIGYTLKGIQNGQQNSIYAYNFTGLLTGLSANFTFLELQNIPLRSVFEASWFQGLYNVNLSSTFVVPELQGRGFKIDTTTFTFASKAKYKLLEWPKGYLQIGGGLGFYFHEVEPELRRVQGGTLDGKIIFVETTFHGPSFPIEAMIAHSSFTFVLEALPILFSGLSEEAAQTPGIQTSDFPLKLHGSFYYRFLPHWSAGIKSELFFASGESSGAGERLDKTYTDGKTNFSFLRGFGSIQYHF